MFKQIVLATTLLLSVSASAQLTRKEEVHPDKDPARDAKPNSDKVPDGISVSTQFDRIVVMRFKYDTDLLAGLEQQVKEQKIRNGVILAGIGAVRGYALHNVINRTLPNKVVYRTDPTAPADIAGMNGYIVDGKIHPHISLAREEGLIGGHLDPGNKVFIYAIVTVGVLPDLLDMSKFEDNNYR